MRNNHQSVFVCPSSGDMQSDSRDVSLLCDSLLFGVCFFLHVWNYLTGWHNPAVWCCAHRALRIYDGGPLKHFEAVSQLEDDVKLYPEWKALILAHSPHLSYDMYFSLALYNIECVFISKCWCGAQDQLFIDLLIVFLVFLLTDCTAVIFKCIFLGRCITASDITLL